MIIACCRTILSEITKLFNCIWIKKEVPEEWKESIVVPISKKSDVINVVIIEAYHFGQLHRTVLAAWFFGICNGCWWPPPECGSVQIDALHCTKEGLRHHKEQSGQNGEEAAQGVIVGLHRTMCSVLSVVKVGRSVCRWLGHSDSAAEDLDLRWKVVILSNNLQNRAVRPM